MFGQNERTSRGAQAKPCIKINELAPLNIFYAELFISSFTQQTFLSFRMMTLSLHADAEDTATAIGGVVSGLAPQATAAFGMGNFATSQPAHCGHGERTIIVGSMTRKVTTSNPPTQKKMEIS